MLPHDDDYHDGDPHLAFISFRSGWNQFLLFVGQYSHFLSWMSQGCWSNPDLLLCKSPVLGWLNHFNHHFRIFNAHFCSSGFNLLVIPRCDAQSVAVSFACCTSSPSSLPRWLGRRKPFKTLAATLLVRLPTRTWTASTWPEKRPVVSSKIYTLDHSGNLTYNHGKSPFISEKIHYEQLWFSIVMLVYQRVYVVHRFFYVESVFKHQWRGDWTELL